VQEETFMQAALLSIKVLVHWYRTDEDAQNHSRIRFAFSSIAFTGADWMIVSVSALLVFQRQPCYDPNGPARKKKTGRQTQPWQWVEVMLTS